MKSFKSVKRLREASLEDMAAVVGKGKASILYAYFHPGEEDKVNKKE